jgi:ribosomal protein L7/L12
MNVEIQMEGARKRIAKLEAEMRFLYKHLGVTFAPTFELDPADKDVAEWLRKGDEMKAIAAYRGAHSVGLNEAKAAVDEIRAGLGLGF